MTLVEGVRTILLEAEYIELSRPFRVGSLPFEFSAAFIGRDKSLDLIVVLDLNDGEQGRLVQRVRALARALDLAKSRRPLTAVLLGVERSENMIESISEVCRVLPIGLPEENAVDQTLRDWLAVLLPLPELDELSGMADPEAELLSLLPNRTEQFDPYMSMANIGAEAVENYFAKRVREQVKPALQEDTK